MGRPKNNSLLPYMYPAADRGGFRVTNPITGKSKRFAEEDAAREAAKMLAEWVRRQRQLKLLDEGRPTIATLVTLWLRDRMQFEPWDEGTRKNMIAKMHRIEREIGDRPLHQTDRMFLEDWIAAFCHTGDTFNKWRYALILLWRFAESRRMADVCEPEKIEPRSTSKKLPMNRKRRRRLDVGGFKAVYDLAPSWLQLAMAVSLVTLQARQEVCNMRHADFRDGHLFVIRDKVSGDTDMAFIKIALTPQLEDLRRRALTLDSAASPYLVHRAPERRRREWIEGKPHWTYLNPQYLSKTFEATRDKSERWKGLAPRERPTFHEIRSLGARIYRAAGMAEADIQALMTHADERTTKIYLERGAGALTDADYHLV
ncbi:MAG: tyrosine-type recombinase/integrase, partial [Steroidobacteraceae bacterium]